jgi:hypothetical protein
LRSEAIRPRRFLSLAARRLGTLSQAELTKMSSDTVPLDWSRTTMPIVRKEVAMSVRAPRRIPHSSGFFDWQHQLLLARVLSLECRS